MYVQSDRNIPRIFRSQGPPNYDSNLHETSRVTDGLTSDNTLLWIFWVINYTVSLIIESLKLEKFYSNEKKILSRRGITLI